MNYDSFIPHPSTFITSRDPASEGSVLDRVRTALSVAVPVIGAAAIIAAVAFAFWWFFIRAKAGPSVAAQSAAEAVAEINPFNWK